MLRAAGETVTAAGGVAAQRLRDQAGEAELELRTVAERLGLANGERGGEGAPRRAWMGRELAALHARVQTDAPARKQLGPVNPLAQQEYAEAVAHGRSWRASART